MSFWYNGIKSNDLHVIVEHYPIRPIPKRKMEKVQVAGRNRDLIYTQDAFENVTQPYDVYISAEYNHLPEYAAKAAAWLLGAKDYVRLEDTYYPDIYRLGLFSAPAEIQNRFNDFGRATITFDCDPRRFWKSGEKPVVMRNGGAIFNPTPCVANPTIIISGSGAGTLAVGSRTVEIRPNFDGVMYLDCDDGNAFADAEETQSANHFIRVDSDSYPALAGGRNIVSWTGDYSVTIIPNWWSV